MWDVGCTIWDEACEDAKACHKQWGDTCARQPDWQGAVGSRASTAMVQVSLYLPAPLWPALPKLLI